jgi:hypothetical protein
MANNNPYEKDEIYAAILATEARRSALKKNSSTSRPENLLKAHEDFEASHERNELAADKAFEMEKAALSDVNCFGDKLSFEQKNRHRWAALAARYEAGARDREAVCAHVARNASKAAARGYRGRHNFSLELVGVGYPAALVKWDELIEKGGYDPRRDTGGGIEAAIFVHVKGYMCNAAAEMTHRLGIRAHEKGEVLPLVCTHDARRDDGLGSTGTTPTKKLSDDQTDSALRAPTDIFGPVKPPAEASSLRTSKQAREAAEICLYDELEKHPSHEERELIMTQWGVLDRRKETVEVMAKRLGKTESTMARKLKRLLQEITDRARKDNPRMTKLPQTFGLTLKGGVARRTAPSLVKDKPLFVKGALVSKRCPNKAIPWGSWSASL